MESRQKRKLYDTLPVMYAKTKRSQTICERCSWTATSYAHPGSVRTHGLSSYAVHAHRDYPYTRQSGENQQRCRKFHASLRQRIKVPHPNLFAFLGHTANNLRQSVGRQQNYMIFNPYDKRKCIRTNFPQFSLHGSYLTSVTSFKYLGHINWWCFAWW